MQGTVKHVNVERGFYFIRADSNHPDIFLGQKSLENSDVEGDLKIGDRLEFDVKPSGRNNDEAINVRRVA